MRYRKDTSPLNLYKQLPQTNCKKCGEATCMAYAAGLIARTRKVEECTPLIDEKKYAKKLEALRSIVAPELKMIYIGVGDKQVKVGGEDVMFRHQMTFRTMIHRHFYTEFFCNADCCENIVHPVDMGF